MFDGKLYHNKIIGCCFLEQKMEQMWACTEDQSLRIEPEDI